MPAAQGGSNTKTYALQVGGVDLTLWSDVQSIGWTESGSEAAAQFECIVESGAATGKTFSSPPDFTGQELYLKDLTNSRKLFGGFVISSRRFHGPGPVVFYHLRAVSFDALLDRESIVRWRSVVNITAKRTRKMATDREMVQSIMGNYGYDLSAKDTNVASTNDDMPVLTLTSLTVRDALTTIADAAASSSNQTSRRFYVDFDKALHYFKANEGTSAPYKIGDALYDGSTIIPDYIEYEKDVTDAAKKVYVKGSNKKGTDWVVRSTNRPYDSIDIIDRPESDTVEAVTAFGAAYLKREGAPVSGGHFSVTGYDGWRAGQTVNIHDAALGLNDDYQIREIQASPNMGNGKTTYTVYYGSLPWRGTFMLTRKKRSVRSTGDRSPSGGSGTGDGASDPPGGGGGSGCFVAGTLVDGPNGARPIESFSLGDALYAVDLDTMDLAPSVVTAVKRHPANVEPMLLVTLANGEQIEATAGHRFYDPATEDFHPISEFSVGDVVLDYSGGSAKELRILSIEDLGSDPTDVFNLTVAAHRNYLVAGVLVHNIKLPNP